MKFLGKKITPVSRLGPIDIRPFYAFLDRIRRWRYRKKRATLLHINDVQHKSVSLIIGKE